MGHGDSQLKPYKACGLELHPSMIDKSARALFSLQPAVHTHTYTRTHACWDRSVSTTDVAGPSPLWPDTCGAATLCSVAVKQSSSGSLQPGNLKIICPTRPLSICSHHSGGLLPLYQGRWKWKFFVSFASGGKKKKVWRFRNGSAFRLLCFSSAYLCGGNTDDIGEDHQELWNEFKNK